MNMKRNARYLKCVPSAKCLIGDQHIPAVHDRVHRQSRSLVKITTISELEFRRSRIIRPDNWTCRRDGDETFHT